MWVAGPSILQFSPNYFKNLKCEQVIYKNMIFKNKSTKAANCDKPIRIASTTEFSKKNFAAISSMIAYFASYDVNLSLASRNFPRRYMYLCFFWLYLSLNQYITGFCTVFTFPSLNTTTKIIASKFCRCPSGTQGDCCRINNYPM